MMAKPRSTAFSEEEYRMIESFKTHFEEFSKYLAVYLATTPPNDLRSSTMQKLSRLTMHAFHELSTDVYDELIRRQQGVPVVLPARDDYHPMRNQARRDLAALPMHRFEEICADMRGALLRRYPEFRVNRRRSVSWMSKL